MYSPGFSHQLLSVIVPRLGEARLGRFSAVPRHSHSLHLFHPDCIEHHLRDGHALRRQHRLARGVQISHRLVRCHGLRGVVYPGSRPHALQQIAAREGLRATMLR